MSMAGVVLEVNATDEQLVAAVRRGDDRSFEELYGRYQRRITAYVAGMVKDHGRAEDVTQEVFVSALRRMQATERPIAFKPWIYEIARNACIDQFRRTRRTDEVSFDADDGAIVAREAGLVSPSTPDAAMDAKQQIDDLCGAFGGLSDAHHEILVMRELEGLSYREIGDRLGLSRPSVESTLFRARRRLTEEYDELVSGERCRKVSELLAVGVDALGTRDERRLARHVAHCQPCRRQAYAAGIDAATLTRHRRRDSARRVAALFPLPAFLRWSHTVSPVAEPAAGLTKALAAAAVIVAGGAGIAAHGGAPTAPKEAAAPVPAQVVTHAVRHQRVVAAPVRRTRSGAAARHRAEVTIIRKATSTTAVKPQSLKVPVTPGPRPAVAPPARVPAGSAAVPTASGAKVPTAPDGGGSNPDAPGIPVVPDVVHQVANTLTQVNGGAGSALSDTAAKLGLKR